MSFFEELKRRNVFRVGIAYGVAGWVVLQIADLVLEAIEAPAWVLKALLLLAILGFAVALVIAWAYEMTPEGIKKESEVDRSQSVVAETGRKMDRIIIGFLVVAVLVLLYRQSGAPEQGSEILAKPAANQAVNAEAQGQSPGPVAGAESNRQSIAVLPFRDMSAAGDQAYFGEGIAEELLNSLVKLEGLKVASRTSSFSLAGEGLDIPAIAQRLDVTNILEGSVRTSGQQVRVTAQLIDVNEDVHLWSETYDGTLDDIFKIQDEITSKITEAMKVQLGGAKLVSAAEKLTSNPEAYQLYLQGRHLWRQRNGAALHQAIKLFTRATELDPHFHQAWSNLAVAHLNLPDYDRSYDTDAEFKLGLEAANKALEIDPQSTEALIIKANYEGWICNAAESARLYEQAIAANPNDPTAHHWYAINLGVAGRLELAMEHVLKAREIDPLISAVLSIEATLNRDMGRYEQADKIFRAASALGFWGGSLYEVGLNLIFAGERENGIKMIAGDPRFASPESQQRQQMWFAALRDPSKLEALETYVGLAKKAQYANADAIQMLTALGSHHAIVYQSELACPQSDTSFWSEPFREQRGTPEFFRLMERAGIVEYWREFAWPDDCASLDQELAECPK